MDETALGAVGALPSWNLADLYTGADDPRLEDDLAWAETAASEFAERYRGRLAVLDGGAFGEAIRRYETIMERLGRVLSYAQLHFAADMADPERGRFLQTMQERYTDITGHLLFFTLEINRLDEDTLGAKMDHPLAAGYRPWLRDLRAFRPHQLSDELEELLHDKSVVGATAWMRLFDQTIAEASFDVDGEALTLADALNRLDNPSEAVRRGAAKAIGRGLGERISTFALILNTLAKDKEIEDDWRAFPHPVAARNLANRVDDRIVEALVAAIRGAYGELSHRYYRLKAKWFRKAQLDYWDRNAPLPGEEDRLFTWAQAEEIVRTAFARFDPRLAEIAERFFSHPWIDASPRPGKDPGAFCHPVVPSVHPYILLNFFGRPRDVTTLAHELGHGVHQVLAAAQGPLLADTPLTLAESASVFGEMLVFQAMLAQETDRERRRRLLASKVESMLNTVVRQIAFHEFERRVHLERRRGELAVGRIGEIWLEVQKESLGDALRFDEEYGYYWAYIPHFIHSPFYVYAYAFGDCLVNSLYQVYREGAPGFQDHYLDMLRAGGTLRHEELLAPFGLDPADPGFWRRGLDVIVGFIDELEQIQ